MSTSSKMQIRAQVLQSVLRFKNSSLPADSDVSDAISVLKEIENHEFVANVLLKEISGSGCIYDNILTLLLFSICDADLLTNEILKFLNDLNTSDAKKLYLINILREQGQKVDYEFIKAHVSNPDDAIDVETRKFLQCAQISPEVQIDFFDFYFTVSADDKNMLINSIIDDYSGDELASLLEPFAYFYPKVYINEKILGALESSKSYYALKPLKWCADNCCDVYLAKMANKCYQKMLLLGFDGTRDDAEIFNSFLKNSKPLNFYYSCADGNSNISCVFARKKDSGFIQTFFTVFNLFIGPIACFGFDEISNKDFNIILSRFFNSSLYACINLNDGRAIFDELSSRGWQDNVSVPYEFICWRRLTYDIKLSKDFDFNNYLVSGLQKVKVSEKMLYEIFNSSIFSSWFYDCNTSPLLFELADNILKNKISNMNKIDNLVNTLVNSLLEDKIFKERLVEQICFQSFILNNANLNTTANALYSTIFDQTIFKTLVLILVQKSLYMHFVNLASVQQQAESSIFRRRQNIGYDVDFVKKMPVILEEKWVIKEE